MKESRHHKHCYQCGTKCKVIHLADWPYLWHIETYRGQKTRYYASIPIDIWGCPHCGDFVGKFEFFDELTCMAEQLYAEGLVK